MKRIVTLSLAAISLFSSASAFADVVGEFRMSLADGISMRLQSFSDPKVKGITCYIADTVFIARLEDASNSGISCVQTGPIVISKAISRSLEGEVAGAIKKSAGMGSLEARRYYDAANDTMSYVIYINKAVGGSPKVAVSTVALQGKAQWN